MKISRVITWRNSLHVKSNPWISRAWSRPVKWVWTITRKTIEILLGWQLLKAKPANISTFRQPGSKYLEWRPAWPLKVFLKDWKAVDRFRAGSTWWPVTCRTLKKRISSRSSRCSPCRKGHCDDAIPPVTLDTVKYLIEMAAILNGSWQCNLSSWLLQDKHQLMSP